MSGNGGDWSRVALRLGLAGLRPRLALLGISVLCYLLLLEVSVVAGLAGRPWWGVATRQDPEGRQTVAWLEPNGLAWGYGLRVGDVLVEVDGGPPPTDGDELNTAGELRTASADGSRRLVLRRPELAVAERVELLSAAAVSLFFVLAGALVYLRATTRRQARAFGVLCASAALTLLSVPPGPLGHPWAVRLIFVGVTLVPAAFACFFLIFPIDLTQRDGLARILAPSLAVPLAITLVLYAATLAGQFQLFEWAQRAIYANMILGYSLGLALLLRSYFGECTPRARQQLRIAVGGTVLGMLPFLGLSVLPNSLAVGKELPVGAEWYIVAPEITVLGTVLIPLSFGYAMLKHQIMEADVVIRRSVVYVAATLATIVCYLLTVSVFQALYRLATGHSSTITLVASALIVALAVEPIRRATQSWVERVFFSDIHAYRQILDTSGPSLNTILSPEELVSLVVGTVTAALPVNQLALLVADRGGASYRLRWDHGGPQPGDFVLDRHHPAVRQLEANSRAIVMDAPLVAPPPAVSQTAAGGDGQAEARTGEEGSSDTRPPEIRVLVPLKTGGQVIAMLALGERSDGEPYSGADLEFLDSAAARYAVALDNALLHETVRRQADTDALTGTYNHRFLLERLSTEASISRQLGRPLSVLMIDVDSFKFFNDTYGHPVGDRVLVAVSQALQAVCRPGDIFGRYGGDEFVAILPNTGRDDANQVADWISAAAQRLVFQADGIGPISLSATIGVAVMPEDGNTTMQLISAADVAMYGRKRAASLAADTLPDVSDLPSAYLRALIVAAQKKDGFVTAHSERAAHWAVRLAVALGLPEHDRQALRIAGLLHDVGKLGIPDDVLNKVEPLAPEEWKLVEQHVELSVRLINDVPYQEKVIEAVAHHHERWDGLGYPLGLRGEAIPLSGRILAVADAYSAMTTDRPYRSRLTQEEAAERISRQAGAQLDARIVDALLEAAAAGDGIVIGADSNPAAEPQDLTPVDRPIRTSS